MAQSHVITTRLDAETMSLVERLSRFHGRSRAWFAAEAIKRLARHEEEFLDFAQEGIDAADRGELAPQDEVFDRVLSGRKKRSAA